MTAKEYLESYREYAAIEAGKLAAFKEAEERLKNCKKNITVAIMGCAVNGPGEAREADIGIAGGNNQGLIFKKGEIVRKVPEDQLLNALVEEIESL